MLARASAALVRRGFLPPVLVGGGAVELFSASAIATGDIDVSVIRQDIFEEELRALGFQRPTGPGRATRGWVHPDIGLGFEVVSDQLLDGNTDRARVRTITVADAGEIAVLPVEDLIADRAGQYASGTAPEMLVQARILFNLYPDLDIAYLDDRIRQETAGTYGIDIVQS